MSNHPGLVDGVEIVQVLAADLDQQDRLVCELMECVQKVMDRQLVFQNRCAQHTTPLLQASVARARTQRRGSSRDSRQYPICVAALQVLVSRVRHAHASHSVNAAVHASRTFGAMAARLVSVGKDGRGGRGRGDKSKGEVRWQQP